MIEAILCIIIVIVTFDIIIDSIGTTRGIDKRDDLETDPPTQRATND